MISADRITSRRRLSRREARQWRTTHPMSTPYEGAMNRCFWRMVCDSTSALNVSSRYAAAARYLVTSTVLSFSARSTGGGAPPASTASTGGGAPPASTASASTASASTGETPVSIRSVTPSVPPSAQNRNVLALLTARHPEELRQDCQRYFNSLA